MESSFKSQNKSLSKIIREILCGNEGGAVQTLRTYLCSHPAPTFLLCVGAAAAPSGVCSPPGVQVCSWGTMGTLLLGQPWPQAGHSPLCKLCKGISDCCSRDEPPAGLRSWQQALGVPVLQAGRIWGEAGSIWGSLGEAGIPRVLLGAGGMGTLPWREIWGSGCGGVGDPGTLAVAQELSSAISGE